MKPDPENLTRRTLGYYEENPAGFWEATKDHDVSQNYASFLRHIRHAKPWTLLDLGCGPGRDLRYFSALGHAARGLDGCAAFCRMARDYSGCEVLHQDFISLNLPAGAYHGIFANASLFHVPKPEFSRVLGELQEALVKDGILFSSNPRGRGEDFDGSRYANFMELEEYREAVEAAGFALLDHYYRPPGLPAEERRWLACVFRKKS